MTAGMYVALLPALIHIYIFVLESFLWGRPRTNRVFGIKSEADAAATKPLAFNQGFYNLFLALGILLGMVGVETQVFSANGLTLIAYSLISIIGAGFVLILSSPKLWRGAAIQIVPAGAALAALLLGY